MKIIKHRFSTHKISPETETLIIGTFNPETPGNEAEFFYGRSRNYLWRLLPTAYGENDLKGATKTEKLEFIEKFKIDLIDLIEEIEVEEGQEANYDDKYIDKKVRIWQNVISEMNKLPNLKCICFTRKTFSGIPNMKKQIAEIQAYCANRGLSFKALTTPARFYSLNKQAIWNEFFNSNQS
jgi:G:T/U-mismatch repair DNA glycosylase